MKPVIRPDQDRRASVSRLSSLTCIGACMFATRICSYLTGITFKLSMAFIVLTAL